MSQDLPRKIGFWGGSAIMVGIIIGSGIFATPPAIARKLGSPTLILGLWVLGGVLSLLGALTYAELGTMYPRSGGIYVYLNEGLGGCVAFVFGWTYMLITKPFAAAGIATVFADHFNQIFGLHLDLRIMTCAILLALTSLNVLGTKIGSGVAVVLTTIKLLALGGIVALGLALTKGSTAHFAATTGPESIIGPLAIVMGLILWTYDGWSDVTAIAGEVTDPRRNLPRILLMGTAAVTALYVAVNAVYIYMVPLGEMGKLESTVAPLVMHRLLGSAGATVVIIMILISTLGATHGSIITGARITFAQARDGLLFRFLGRIHPKHETPDTSLWIQAILSCAASLFLGSFQRLANAFVFTMWIFYGLAGAAIIVLRLRRPDVERTYRCWGYPVVPILFILGALGMTILSIVESWKKTVPWIGVLVAGAPIYYLWKRFARPEPA